MSNSPNLEETILQAVDIVASKKIASAGYDKTIQATIVSCVDATIGKYKVKYQDGFFFAYSANMDTSYSDGSTVFILVPGGDMSRDKTILGTTKKLGINYVTVAEGDQMYTPIGSNIISSSGSWDLCSYVTDTKILYSAEKGINQISIDTAAAEEYLKRSNYIVAGGYVRNNLDVEQQHQGNYGITFALDFIDNATRQQVTRRYAVDVDKMTGDPYKLMNETRQYGVFEIDGVNFVRINQISLFVEDFPNTATGKPTDITISQLELTGAVSLFNEDPNSACALVLVTPQGYIFDSGNSADDTKTITAQLRVKGKTVDPASQKLPYYWFVQNLFITPRSKEYSKYGGQGWQCLNQYNVVQQGETDDKGVEIVAPVVEFLPGSESIQVKKSESLAKNTKYKCAVIYQGKVFTQQITIINNDSEYQIEVTSDKGQEFYYDIGNPTLTCTCKKKSSSGTYEEVDPETLRFIWGSSNNANNFSNLPSTDEYNEDYASLSLLQESIKDYLNAEWIRYEDLVDINKLFPSDYDITHISEAGQREDVQKVKDKIVKASFTAIKANDILKKYNIIIGPDTTWSKLLDTSESDTATVSKSVESYDVIQRVEGNRIIDLNVRNITQFTIFKCSVFTKSSNQFLGTASINLNNTLAGEDLYSLVINNGSQVFKYNTHGVAPTSKQMKTPLEIPTLTFTIFDNLGNPIDNSIIKHSDIIWTVPAKNTLLVVPEPNYDGEILTPDQLLNITADNVKIFTGNMSFDYKIAERFDYGKTQNNIELRVNYNGLNLVAKTDFTFTKQGMSGTNGTDFVCKVVPRVTSGSIPTNPTIYYDGYNTTFNWNCDGTHWFEAQLWHNGNEPIFSGYETNTNQLSTEGKPVIVVAWQVLRNKYGKQGTADALKMDSTNINVSGSTFSFNPGNLSSSYTQEGYAGWRPANIIKVTLSYDGYTYYGTLPVIVVRNFYSSSYRVNLKPGTGFRQVVYSGSGIQPEYDNHNPFELVVERFLGGDRWQDVSNKTYVEDRMEFKWFYMGSIWFRDKTGDVDIGDGTKRKKSVYQWVQEYETTTSDGKSSKKWLMDWNNAYSQDQKSCQVRVKPADEYNGECLNIGMACRVSKASSGATVAWIHIPIHMLRNRFSNSAINGWDGNSVELGDGNGGTILAPQVGAGIKEDDNSFTGILIGTSKDPKEEGRQGEEGDTNNYSGRATQGLFAKRDEQVGLFGYHKGSRSIFLDARTGKSVFGESGQAQIVIDPSQIGEDGKKKAIIQSGDYLYRPYDQTVEIDKVDTEVEAGRKWREPAGTGMMIDLSTPQIKFGSGNFELDKNGHIIARGGGSIGGWQITDHAMYNKKYGSVKINTTGMNSNPVVMENSKSTSKEYNGSQTRKIKVPPTNSDEGNTGWKQVLKAAAFWAGDTKFIVTHDGYLHAEQASIGSGTKPIYIGRTRQSEKQESGGGSSESVIFSGYKNAKNASQVGFYLGTDGFALGGTTKMYILKENAPVASDELYDPKTGKIKDDWFTERYISNFQVQPNGMFYARRGYIGNGRQGWQIGNTFLRNQKLNINDVSTENGVYIGTQGIALGRVNATEAIPPSDDNVDGVPAKPARVAFRVTDKGVLTATQGRIADWVISDGSIRTEGSPDRYSHKEKGKDPITGAEGVVIEVVDTKGMYFGKGGLRLGANFHVNDQGILYAKDGIFSGRLEATTGTLGAWTIDQVGIMYQPNPTNIHIYPTEIKMGTVKINSTGFMGCDNGVWDIQSDGVAHFSNMNMSGGTVTGGTIGGSGGTTPTIQPKAVAVSGGSVSGSNLENYIQQLIVNKLKVDYLLETGTKSTAIFRGDTLISNKIRFATGKVDGQPNSGSGCTIFVGSAGSIRTCTGTAIFSGGGKMYFENGLLWKVEQQDGDIKTWEGNNNK